MKRRAFIATIGAVLVVGAAVLLLPKPIVKSRERERRRCIENLWALQHAKRLWMIDYEKTINDVPTWDDLKPYMRVWVEGEGWQVSMPVCPNGGTYVPGPVRERPTCSLGGPWHSLPKGERPFLFEPE